MDSLLEPVIETDKETFCLQIMKRLDCLRRNEHLCDVIVEVGSCDGLARLKAHRNVLCAASPFFYNALNTEMKEKKEGVIRLKDTSKALMEEVLEYLYTGHADVNDKNAYELMAVADYILIPSLKYVCSKYIQQTLSISTCLMAYYSSVKYQCAELKQEARSFILANFMAVTETEDFLNLSLDQVEEWISSDDIVVKGEEEVFKAILKWTQKNARRKRSFSHLFCHVRCVYISPNFLFTVVLQHEFVKNEKKCMDMVLSALKESTDGTEACFLKQPPRSCLRTYEDVIFGCGGVDGSKLVCYLPSENKWYKLRCQKGSRNRFALTTSVCQGKLYVVGGNTSGSAAARYDPIINKWSSIKSFRQEITHPAAVTFRGFLYLIGGVDNSKGTLRTVLRYNPDTDLWQEDAPLCGPRSRACAVSDENYIYAIGGMSSSEAYNSVEKFDPETNSWNPIASMQGKRRNPCGVSLHNRIFVFGGVEESGGSPCEVYDKEENVWTVIANALAPRFPASAVCFKEQIFVFGGFGSRQNWHQDMILQVYDVDRNEWKPCGNASLGNYMYKLSAGRVLRDVLKSCAVI